MIVSIFFLLLSTSVYLITPRKPLELNSHILSNKIPTDIVNGISISDIQVEDDYNSATGKLIVPSTNLQAVLGPLKDKLSKKGLPGLEIEISDEKIDLYLPIKIVSSVNSQVKASLIPSISTTGNLELAVDSMSMGKIQFSDELTKLALEIIKNKLHPITVEDNKLILNLNNKLKKISFSDMKLTKDNLSLKFRYAK